MEANMNDLAERARSNIYAWEYALETRLPSAAWDTLTPAYLDWCEAVGIPVSQGLYEVAALEQLYKIEVPPTSSPLPRGNWVRHEDRWHIFVVGSTKPGDVVEVVTREGSASQQKLGKLVKPNVYEPYRSRAA
jgi:hypothetical protein